MTPLMLSGIITGVESIIGVIADAYHNGQISDADLETGTASANATTRKMIADEIAKRSGTPPTAVSA